MVAARERVRLSKKTQADIEEAMGYPPASARQAVSQFLKSGDPQINMFRRFTEAMGISVGTLLKSLRPGRHETGGAGSSMLCQRDGSELHFNGSWWTLRTLKKKSPPEVCMPCSRGPEGLLETYYRLNGELSISK